MERHSVKKSIFLMTCTNAINKGLGAVYNIALVYLLTSKGVGLLNNALNIYTTLVVLFTSGFATALARLIAENTTAGKHKYAHRLFKVSFYIFLIIGVLSGFMMYYGATYLAIDSDVNLSIYVLIPALFFVSLTTIFRGYFQGMAYTMPIALAQTVEQITKITVGTVLVSIWMPDLPLAAFGAAAGFTVGAFVSLCCFVYFYLKYRVGIHARFEGEIDRSPLRIKDIELIRTMIRYVIPVSIGGFLVQTIGIVDQFMINKILPMSGYDVEQVKLLYGVITGQVAKLIDIPSVITIAIAVNMLPAITRAFGLKQMEGIRRKTITAYTVVLLFAMPAAFGLAFLGQPIMEMVYGRHANAVGGAMLALLGYSVIFIALIQINNSILQGMGRLYIPVFAVSAGFVVKILVSTLVLYFPSRVITIIALGSLGFYMTTSMIGLYFVNKVTQVDKGELIKRVTKIFFASLGMTLAVTFTYRMGMERMEYHRIVTILSIIIGILSYGVLSFILSGDIVFEIIGGKRRGKN